MRGCLYGEHAEGYTTLSGLRRCSVCHDELLAFRGNADADFNAGIDPQGVNAYEPEVDRPRLKGQLLRVFDAMSIGGWRTLRELSDETGDPEASVSAQLRHLRKERFGSYIVEKRRRGGEASGTWEYRLSVRLRGDE